MAGVKVRIDEQEANRLDALLRGKDVLLGDGTRGRVARITKGGIQLLLPTKRGVHPYPLYDSFASGRLKLSDEACQQEVVRVLRMAATKEGVTPSAELRAEPSASRKPRVSQVDVPTNVRFACFFKNADEERLREHMVRVGLEGFEESLEAGFKRDPFVALRETEYFLGCSLELLLKGFEEYVQQIFKECLASKTWGWEDAKSDQLQDGTPHRSVFCKSQDEKRSFLVQTVYADESMRDCLLIQVNFTDLRKGLSELRTIQGRVFGPTQATVSAFDTAFKAAGGVFGTAPHPNKPSSRAGAPASVQANLAVAPATGQNASGTDRRQPKPIRVNEFLVRKSYGTHRANGHSLEPVRATVSILPKAGGDPRPEEFDGYWCPKCRKYFMTEGTYIRLKRQGYICCKVVEEKDLGTRRAGEGLYGNLASESVLHMYGYTVNQQDDLSEAERRTIISFVIENRIQSAQDVAHLLEWLISQREGNPRMSVAVGRWRADLAFVRHYHRPMRKVRVDSIYAKI